MDDRCRVCRVEDADLAGCEKCDRLVCDGCGSFDVQGHYGALVCMICAKRLSGSKAQAAAGDPPKKAHKHLALAETMGSHSSEKGLWRTAWNGSYSMLVAWRNSLWAVLHIYVILLATGLATMTAIGLYVNTGAAVGDAVNTMATSTGEAVGHTLGRSIAARVKGSQVLGWMGMKEAVVWSAGLDTLAQMVR